MSFPHLPCLAIAILAAPTAVDAQQRAALFDAAVVVVPETQRIEHLFDCNGDGRTDAVGSWQPATNRLQVNVWLNSGTGGLTESWSVTGAIGAISHLRVRPGDFDGDGLDDFLIDYRSNGSDSMTGYRSLGDGTFTPVGWWSHSEATPVKDIVTADLDQDGLCDVAYVTDTELKILRSQPGGGVLLAATVPVGSGDSRELFLAEADGDGVPDLGLVSWSTSTLLQIFQTTSSGPVPGPTFTLNGVHDPMPASGDIDGDADQDIVVFQMHQYWVLRRTGAATFTLEAPVAGGPATDLVDVDGDGDLDGVCCSGGGGGGGGTTLPPNATPSTFRVTINHGGQFAPAFEIPGLGAEHIAGAADVDADGDVDLVAGRCIYYCPGQPGPLASTGIATGDLAPAAIADVDRDGDVDLQVGPVGMQRNAADGTFARVTPIVAPAPAGTQFGEPAIPGDFDGDGDADLLVAHRASGVFLAMRLLRNRGGGSFDDAGDAGPTGVEFAPVFDPRATTVADADGDGDLDLFLAPPNAAANFPTRLWRNDGTGSFTAAPDLPGVLKGVAILTDDLLPDVLLADPASSWLRLHEGRGNGVFAATPSTFGSIAAFLDQVALGDFDQDGDLDLVRPNSFIVDCYRNDGGTTWSNVWVWMGFLTGGPGVRNRAFATDVDADGRLDVVLSPALHGANSSHVFLGTGPGIMFVRGSQQVFLPEAFADTDGDGDADAIGPVVCRNRRFEGVGAGSIRQYADGLAGTGGIVPTLGEVGPFRPGHANQLRVTGALGGSLGIVVLGYSTANIPMFGGSLLVSPDVYWLFPGSGQPMAPGAGEYVLPWSVAPGLVGFQFWKQVGIFDPGAPQGIAMSNVVRIALGG